MMVPPLDYYVDAKQPHTPVNLDQWDVFVSAFNDSMRVQRTFNWIRAARKVWWILPEYGYVASEVPAEGSETHIFSELHEAELIRHGLSNLLTHQSTRLCIDVTGIMRQHILFIMRFLSSKGFTRFDFLYTEPEHYARKAETTFSIGEVSAVRQVAGFEGQHSTDTSNDVLIMGCGYDHLLVGRVLLSRENAKFVQLHSLPSLSADMYHEALLRLDRIGGLTGIAAEEPYFSSANDPYVTATTLSEAYATLQRRKTITNLYLSSLATKPQAIGFGLFYLRELENTASSIIFPCISQYSRETGKGVGRTWIYPIDLA